jgi:hypothetical protein
MYSKRKAKLRKAMVMTKLRANCQELNLFNTYINFGQMQITNERKQLSPSFTFRTHT